MIYIDKTIYGCSPEETYALEENGNPLIILRYQPDFMVKVNNSSFLKMSSDGSEYVIKWDSGKKLNEIRTSLSDFHENFLAIRNLDKKNLGEVLITHEEDFFEMSANDYFNADKYSSINKEFDPYGMVSINVPSLYNAMVWRLVPLELKEGFLRTNKLSDTVSMNISSNLDVPEELTQLILETSVFNFKENDFNNLSEVVKDLLDTRNRVIGL